MSARILIVEDDTDIRALIARYLSLRGYEVSEARSADEAREKWRALAPRVALVDLAMSRESGVSLIRSLRHEESGRPPIGIIAMSAFARSVPDWENDAMAAGANVFLPKPFRLETMLDQVKALLAEGSAAGAEPGPAPRFPTALVAGATGGLGRAIAAALSGRGFEVAEISVDDPRAIDGAVGPALARLGAIDVLVNDARGVDPRAEERLVDAPIEAIERRMQATVLTPLRLARLVLPGMIERRSGRIINVIPPAGAGGAEALARAALDRAAGVLALEVRDLGVAVIDVAVAAAASGAADAQALEAVAAIVRLATCPSPMDYSGRTVDAACGR